MEDLYLGFGIVAAVSAVAFWVALHIMRRATSERANLLAIALLLLMAWYTVALWHSVAMTRLLPFRNVVVLGNWFPPAAAFLAGLVWSLPQVRQNRRRILVGGLALAGTYSMVHPLLGEHPTCHDRWRGDVCLQTSPSTCSAASAATLLRSVGIDASEHEMAELCLTRKGTTWAGLYRGLKHKTAGTGWDVEVFRATFDDLSSLADRPVMLSVGIDRDEPVDPDYLDDWGWIPGQPHSVVLFNFIGQNTVVVGDPAIGRELWSIKDLEVLWHGEGIRLVPRGSGPPTRKNFEHASNLTASPVSPKGVVVRN
jgi:hypothetical protein